MAAGWSDAFSARPAPLAAVIVVVFVVAVWNQLAGRRRRVGVASRKEGLTIFSTLKAFCRARAVVIPANPAALPRSASTNTPTETLMVIPALQEHLGECGSTERGTGGPAHLGGRSSLANLGFHEKGEVGSESLRGESHTAFPQTQDKVLSPHSQCSAFSVCDSGKKSS